MSFASFAMGSCLKTMRARERRPIFSPMSAKRFGLAAAILVSAETASAQGSLSGIVVARGSEERLAYAVIALPSLGREQFANDSGAFYFGELQPGVIPLRRVMLPAFSPPSSTS